jgi:6-pyruvoyltetrahydropterin/6-carboxytetrahydropterin synthase
VYTITKDFEFSAAHYLNGLAKDHPCGRLHGHNYRVRVELSTHRLSRAGFVRDYGELDEFKKYLAKAADHRCLNDWMPKAEGRPGGVVNPTAENLAYLFYLHLKDLFPELTGVGVSETPKTWAWFRASIGAGI